MRKNTRKAIEKLDSLHYELKELDYGTFLSLWCMILERRCKEEGTDICATVKELSRVVEDINKKLGEI